MGKYEEFKKLADKEGFYCPEGYIVATDIANTPVYIREWFKRQALENIKDKLKHAQIILCERGDLACGKCFNCEELNKVLAYNLSKKQGGEQG